MFSLAFEGRHSIDGVVDSAVKNHGISQELIQAAMDMSKKFFELPLEKKLALKFNANFRYIH